MKNNEIDVCCFWCLVYDQNEKEKKTFLRFYRQNSETKLLRD